MQLCNSETKAQRESSPNQKTEIFRKIHTGLAIVLYTFAETAANEVRIYTEVVLLLC